MFARHSRLKPSQQNDRCLSQRPQPLYSSEHLCRVRAWLRLTVRRDQHRNLLTGERLDEEFVLARRRGRRRARTRKRYSRRQRKWFVGVIAPVPEIDHSSSDAAHPISLALTAC